ncbi:MAG TPA: ectoine/hydroxyectoine ABC transporter permease subunit EhuD [Spirochaetota bacterium]|nr:ectoine/hydroxyectoine ABC transporter permease subunit EhuD [Spirochaetota bacterium]HPJ37058.1 ectoine/hydroxyectoine ABC transporter permease subunit EhuD [Spirochaetota bacterium]
MISFTWDWSYAIRVMPVLIDGAMVTLKATAAGTVIAVFGGLLFALLRRSGNVFVSKSAGFFVEFIRSTPLLIQIYFVYYILPEFGIRMTPFLTGVISLGLHFSSYMSEVYRAGIDGIPRGQWEAGISLGMTKLRIFKDIIVPQAVPPVIPAMGNYVISMFKETPQLSAITVLEMMQAAKIIGSEEFRYLEPVTMVGVIFLALSLGAAYCIKLLSRKLPMQGIPMK